MAHGRLIAEWNQTASMLAMMFNSHCASKPSEAKSAQDFMPDAKKADKKIITDPKEIDRIMSRVFNGKPTLTKRDG